MRRVPTRKALLFALTLFALLGIAPLLTPTLRVQIAALFSPLWKTSAKVCSLFYSKECKAALQVRHLEAENALLKSKLASVTQEEVEGLLAHVIYRDPTSWNSTFWVDVGSKHSAVIAKNSPVVVGSAVVGVVDYVGKKQSRVRLLTDHKLHPSVRCVRGELKNRAVIEHLDAIIPTLSHNKEYAAFFMRIKARLAEEKETLYLAKGFLEGAAAPLWRCAGRQLVGVGFNYDFADSKGEAKRIDLSNPEALLQEGDLLVTTGMDGVFPPDLFVAFVTKVYPLKEGDVSYKIEAKPYVANLHHLTACTILPPLPFDFDEI